MRTLIWVKHKGKWEISPAQITLTKYPDGKEGFPHSAIMGDGCKNPYWQVWYRYGLCGDLFKVEYGPNTRRRDGRIILK